MARLLGEYSSEREGERRIVALLLPTGLRAKVTNTTNSPGRFLASSVMKAILVHLLTHYDMELERRKGPVSWTWESFEMPSKDSRVIMRPRSAAA